MKFFRSLSTTIFITFVLCGCHSQISKKDKEESFKLSKQSEILLKEGKLDDGERLIDEALKLNPRNYAAYNDLGYIKGKQNKPQQEVINNFKRALEIKPDYAIGHYSLANYYFLIKDYKNTIEIANKYLSIRFTENLDSGLLKRIYFMIAKSEERLMQFDAAITDFKKAIQIDSTDKFNHYELGESYYYGSNDIPDALIEFTKALDIDSTYYQAYIEREKCDRNLNPPLLKQAKSDSINSYKFDTSKYTGPNTTPNKLENFRQSLNPKLAEANAFYNSILIPYDSVKLLQQKFIDGLTVDFYKIKDNSAAIIDIAYLQKLINDVKAANKMLLKKLNNVQEFDSTVDLKNKLMSYENQFKDLLVEDMPRLIAILKYANVYKLRAAMDLIMPKMILIREKGMEFTKTENDFLNKYTLH